jgi:hypothetical protein
LLSKKKALPKAQFFQGFFAEGIFRKPFPKVLQQQKGFAKGCSF